MFKQSRLFSINHSEISNHYQFDKKSNGTGVSKKDDSSNGVQFTGSELP